MKIESVGFIGGGRVVKIILKGWERSGAMPRKVVVSDPDNAVIEALATAIPGIETSTNNGISAAQDLCVLAVHPPLVKDVASALGSTLDAEKQMLVSLAPKFTTAKLTELLGGFSRIARMIPNASSYINEGYNPIAFAEGVSETDCDNVRELFAPLGNGPVVDESTLEAYAIVTAMGPTYFWPQFYCLKALGESFGLSPDASMEAVAKTIKASVDMLTNTGLSEADIEDLVPVKPLAGDVEELCKAMDVKLRNVMEKLRP